MSESPLEQELSAHDTPDPRGAAPHGHHPSPKEYIRIGVVLAVLTGIEVAVSYLLKDEVGLMIPVLLGLGVIKFSLVVMYFMHLKFDDRRYARFFVMGIALATTLYLIVLMAEKVFLR